MKLKILSFNIHKGFSAFGVKTTLASLKKLLDVAAFDIVCLQEIHGEHSIYGKQLEILADSVWSYKTYGKNAVYTRGHHGNAILSKYPISSSENIDISFNKLERRGVLHATILGSTKPFHVFCTHLGLLHTWRLTQLGALCERISTHIKEDESLVLCGDFNDWREKATSLLNASVGLEEAFLAHSGAHAKTFPSWLPILCLDRIYTRGAKVLSAQTLGGGDWRKISDHLAVEVTVEIK